MKTMIFFAVGILLAINTVCAAAPKDEFIRKPGHYSLGSPGSMVTITKEPTGFCSVQAIWKSGDAASTSAPDCPLRGDRWFVFVESPNRIWVFDGVDQGMLLSRSEKEQGVKWLYRGSWGRCPQKFREALPEEVRAGKPKGDDAARQSQGAK